MNGSVDTNILLRVIVGDVPEQQVLAEELLENTEGQLAVADMVFVELEHALTKNYGYTRAEAAEVLTMIALNPKLNCNKHHIAATLSTYKNLTNVSYVDTALATYAEFTDATPLWTFDKNLSKKLPNAKLLV